MIDIESQIKYIELIKGFADNGPAFIEKLELSKSGKKVFLNGKAFKKMNGIASAYSGYTNYYDLEERIGYWIS